MQTMRSYARGTKAAFCKTFNVRVRVNALLFLNSKKSARSDALSSQSELRLPLLQVVSSNKYFSVGVQSPTEINAPRGCAVILKRRCQLALTRITHQVSRAFDLNMIRFEYYSSSSFGISPLYLATRVWIL